MTDTWNHRIQKFDQEGNFLLQWGYFGTAENPDGFWGPRGIAVDQDGRVFITDTGNKRVAVFDSFGGFITQFGEAGFDIGQFDEPVGITIGTDGDVYVADTWNQRIQVFSPNEDHTIYSPINSWEIVGWFGQSLTTNLSSLQIQMAISTQPILKDIEFSSSNLTVFSFEVGVITAPIAMVLGYLPRLQLMLKMESG